MTPKSCATRTSQFACWSPFSSRHAKQPLSRQARSEVGFEVCITAKPCMLISVFAAICLAHVSAYLHRLSLPSDSGLESPMQKSPAKPSAYQRSEHENKYDRQIRFVFFLLTPTLVAYQPLVAKLLTFAAFLHY